MDGRNTNKYRLINIAVDAALTALAYFMALGVSGYVYAGTFNPPPYARGQVWVSYLVVILWPLLFNLNGLYPTNRLRTFAETIKIVARASLQGLLILVIIFFLLKFTILGRRILLEFTAIAAVLLIIKEEIVRQYIRRLRMSGGNLRGVLVVGDPDSVKPIINKLENNKALGLKIAGVLVPSAEDAMKEFPGHRVLGVFTDIEKALNENAIDNVIISTYLWTSPKNIEDIVSVCEKKGVEVWLPAQLFHTKIAKSEGEDVLGMPMFVFRTDPELSWELVVKIVLDRIAGLILGVLSLPIIAVAGILIKFTSPGPVIFRQKRCGYHGRVFTLYKLRTMYNNAEAIKEELAGQNIMKGPVFKLENDPRITPLGRLLRKTSIDELPQFWNVIEGEMSLVGPRPPVPEEVVQYDYRQMKRLGMKPGITGLLQISGRNDITDFNKWVALDLEYIENWSLWLDIKIAFKTIFVVLSTRGAK